MKNLIKKSNNEDPFFSIIDVGSFSIRLVVYDSLSIASRTLFNEKVICNLGRNVNASGNIDSDTINYVINVLDRFIGITKTINSQKPIIIATAAIRMAKNKGEIVDAVFKKFNIKIQILSEKDEGEYAALGTIYSHKEVRGLVGDLGGGSLELTEVKSDKVVTFLNSLPLGHSFLESMGEYYSSHINKYIFKNLKKIDKINYKNFYAVGGSFRVIAKLYMTLQNSDLKVIQDYVIPANGIKEIIKSNLFKKGSINSKLLSKITKSRRNSMPYALNILECLIEYFEIKDIYFSSSGIREGWIKNIISTNSKNTFLYQIERLAHNSMNKDLAIKLYKWISKSLDDFKFNEDLLKSACWISNIAWDVHPEHRRMYAMERVLWYPFYRISREERIELALTMYFRHSNAIKNELAEKYLSQIDENTKIRCRFIGQCLRLAHHITGGISSKNLDSCYLKLKKDYLKLHVIGENSIFYGEAIPRGLKNAANAIGIYKTEIKFNN